MCGLVIEIPLSSWRSTEETFYFEEDEMDGREELAAEKQTHIHSHSSHVFSVISHSEKTNLQQ